MGVLLVFADGVGLGPRRPQTNPLAGRSLPALTRLAGTSDLTAEGLAEKQDDTSRTGLIALDARLGIAGVPQSGTGQTALITGRNAAAVAGRHVGPYPGAALRPLLVGRSLWRALAAASRTACLANAYPDRYLDRAGSGRGRMGAWARSAQSAGVRLRGKADLIGGRAVSPFITNDGWREHLGYEDVPDVSPAGAGEILARLAARHDLTVFEHYATDIAGHRQDRAAAEGWLAALDEMIGAADRDLPENDVLVVVSDHGNVEDLSTPRHTMNPALCIWRGPPACAPLRSLTDVAPAILAHLRVAAHPGDETTAGVSPAPAGIGRE